MMCVKDVLSKTEIINLMQSCTFKLTDPKKITNCEYVGSENPFHPFAAINFDNHLAVIISKTENEYLVCIGKNSGWQGGLERDDIEYSFTIPTLTFADFKTGLMTALISQKYRLVSFNRTGTIRTVHCVGSLDDIKDYAKANYYRSVKTNGQLFDFYFVNDFLPHNEHGKIMQIIVC